MAVTLAGYAASKGATIHHIATETRSARLAELANVALWTRALFYPECIWALVEALPRCAKLDVVNETNTCSTTKKLYFFVVLKKNNNNNNHTGLEFSRSQRAVENREKWRKLVAKSSVVPQ